MVQVEGVRDAALAAGRCFVEAYARSCLPLLLPAVEAGLDGDNWRIRQSSLELCGELLFKVCMRSSCAVRAGGMAAGRVLCGGQEHMSALLACWRLSSLRLSSVCALYQSFA
jgi:hypothetical protein